MTDSPERHEPFGRPTKYKPEYCQEMIDFFLEDQVEHRVDTTSESDKNGRSVSTKLFVKFPSFEKFSRKIDVSRDCLSEWKRVYPDFSVAYDRCKQIQEDIWRENALNGTYNGAFAIFLGKNVFGYKDKSEVEQNTTVTVMPTIRLADGSQLDLDVGEDPSAD